MKTTSLIACLAICTTVSTAQADGLVFDPAHSMNCVERAFRSADSGIEAATGCIALSSERCMMDTPGGNSTAGMSGCLARGYEMWDAELNRVYRILRPQEAEATAANRTVSDRIPSSEEALVTMQRAWIGYRDARCAYEQSQWGGGTGGGPAYYGCLEHETAQQTLFLRAHILQ